MLITPEATSKSSQDMHLRAFPDTQDTKPKLGYGINLNTTNYNK